jgi:putative ABC transport system permease protein
VATPEVLAALGVDAHDIAAKTEFISARTDLGNMEVFDPTLRDASSFPKPTIQRMPQLPTYGSDPTVLITPYGLQKYGLTSTPRNYLFRSSAPLTGAQIDSARRAAAQAGVAIETRKGPKSLVPLRNWATVVGIIVALGVLAMTVGLIRSEAGRDLSTLSATGASSWTRRTITGATTGTLALLGAVLGTAGAYAALTAWFRSDLHPLTQVPWLNLVLIVIALPLIATATGWLLAGRDPATTRRQPLE